MGSCSRRYGLGDSAGQIEVRILILLPRIPVPARDGGAIVMLETVRTLHEAGHHVDVCAVNTPKHHADPSSMADYCSSITAVDVDTSLQPRRMLGEFVRSRFPTAFGIRTSGSYWLTRFASDVLLLRIEKMVRDHGPYDLVLCESLFTACYGEALRHRGCIDRGTAVVLHAHNIEARIQDRLADDPSRSMVERTYRRRLANQTRSYEHHVMSWIDAVITLSTVDADVLSSISPQSTVYTVSPGVRELKYSGQKESRTLWFLGSLDWAPNLDGLRWFMRKVWPRVQAEMSDVTLHIAGRSMPQDVLNLDDGLGVIVHGEIDDPTEFRRRYEVGIVPLQSGSGVRIKIIEAVMEHSAIVTTSVGCEGLPLINGLHALIADDEKAFASACLALLRDPLLRETISDAGAAVLRSDYSGEQSAGRLQSVLRTILEQQR